MKKILLRISVYCLLLIIFIVLFKIFVPRHYQIPPVEKRTGTKFMDLPTGSRIGYTLLNGIGNKKQFPIIYLHGGPGGLLSDKVIQILSNLADAGYDVFLYDQIGGGESARLENIRDYTVDRHIRDLHEIIKNLGREKVILIGQSWGGILSAYYASKYPKEVSKIIFTNPGPLYPYPKELDYLKAPDSFHLKPPFFSNRQGNDKVKNLRTIAMKYCAIHFGIKLASDKEADEFSTYSGYEVNKSTVYDTSKIVKISEIKSIPAESGYYAGIMTFQNLIKCDDPRPKLKELDIPVLVLKSQYDNQIWGGTHEYLTLFKNHHLEIIPDAGHGIIGEQPELYLKYILQFLSK
jgi:proline iminopeptidase